MLLLFATSNLSKLREVRQILEGTDISVENRDIDLPEVQGTPEQVATAKCKHAQSVVGDHAMVLVEDTSLSFHAMGYLPGPYIKYFLSELGVSGLPKLLAGFENKAATVRCVLALSDTRSREPKLFVGETHGTIVEPRTKGHGFGFDPVFLPDGEEHTYAEMEDSRKNAISHRRKAFEALRKALSPHLDPGKKN